MHRVVYEGTRLDASGALVWPGSFAIQASQGLGSAPGEMTMPISFDAGPDSRVYVLDAGNARIQVFDARGEYVTRFGRRGSAAGEFDFGRGSRPEDFVGSLCVDEEGYIYVADVGNRRVQKFTR